MPPTSHRATPVSEVMTSRVHTAGSSESLKQIRQILVDERCHHIPILDEDRLVGMISARDLVRFARQHSPGASSGDAFDGGIAADVMSKNVETIHVAEPVDAAIDRIGAGDIHALAVLGDEGELAGIVTHRDLLQYLAS